MSAQQTINRELFSLMTVVKDDVRAAVASFAKTSELTQDEAVKLTNLLQSTIEGSVIKAHTHFDRNVTAALSNKKA